MWKAIGNLISRAREALGIEIPELPDMSGVGDAATAAGDAVTSQAEEVTTTLGDTATDAAGRVADAGDRL